MEGGAESYVLEPQSKLHAYMQTVSILCICYSKYNRTAS